MKTLVFFDTETVGVPEEISGDIIIQLSGVVSNSVNEMQFDSMCNPNKPMGIEAMEKHNITPDMIEGLPDITKTSAYAIFKTLASRDDVLFVCYNMSMDVEVMKRVGIDITEKTIDLFRVIKLIQDKDDSITWKSTRLSYLIYALELYKKRNEAQKGLGSHNALFDSYDLKLLYEYCVQTFGMTEELGLQITNNPIFYSKVPFGTHKGKRWNQLTPNQIMWIKDNIKDADIQYTISKIGF